MDLADSEYAGHPHHARIMCLPNDLLIRLEHETHKPSLSILSLQSEQNREIFAEAFIEGHSDTLANLCVKALARRGFRNVPQMVLERPEWLRVFYDALDVDLPLVDCYFIDDQRYWQRVVWAKSPDKLLRMKSWHEYDWRAKGLSLKYVELVEDCPAAYWPEAQMAALAALIQEHVSAMHIKRLQVLPEVVFAKNDESEPEIVISSESSEKEDISSDEPDTEEDVALGEDEDEDEEEPTAKRAPSVSAAEPKTGSDAQRKSASFGAVHIVSSSSESSSDEETAERRRARQGRNAARQQLRGMAAEKRAKRLQRRLRRQKMLEDRLRSVEPKKKSKRKKAIKGVFDIPVDPEPSDNEEQFADMRNRELCLRHHKRISYPTELCHHIDLGFVRHFGQLSSFTLEFLGPADTNYQSYQSKFSYDDMRRLAKGLLQLQHLQIFRLRNSLVDSLHLSILARALRSMDSLETVDFGYDQMEDDCCNALQILLDRPKMFKALQLEYNKLGANSMEVIGTALARHKEDCLEYLGLAHNPLCDNALGKLFHHIHGTGHVHSLNISAIEGAPSKVVVIARDIAFLLRHHQPLRRLQMAAIPLGSAAALPLLRALEGNHKILYFDSRACGLDEDQEFQADIIIRRNNYWVTNPPTDDICHLIKNRKHQLMQQMEREYGTYKECVLSRPPLSSSSVSSIAAVIEEKEKEEEEYDIWAVLGIKTRQTARAEIEPSEPSAKSLPPFVFEANKLNLEEFREFVHLPGPSNRFYYFQESRVRD
ncbi:uncharacterized protein LOC117583444 [Drosophila guanche]|uniref:T-complex-associated testis-expressed protein 1 n=1 Tax=Drosophila guanche TaxID=7266 RepID=A0A3B0K5J0_DROGU|nr:uncharacterized protein LOC117583444 [Drosophila guanche]SPP80231.1 Hypothetical predicted protein [Drosophila guanche]